MGAPIRLSGLLPPDGFWGFAFLCLIMGLSVPFYNGLVTVLMQERIPPEYLSRVFGLYGSFASPAKPVGLLPCSFADQMGIRNWFALTGAFCLALAAVIYAIPTIRKIDA